MAIKYEIKHDVLILRVVADRLAELAETVRAASQDAVFIPGMRLLIDLRIAALHALHIRSEIQSLAAMGTILTPRWAVLTADEPSAVELGRLLAIFADLEHVDAEVFQDEHEALSWLRQECSAPRREAENDTE